MGPWSLAVLAAPAAASLVLAVACNGPETEPTTTQAGETLAVLGVERVDGVGRQPQAEARAAFLFVPTQADKGAALDVVRMQPRLPRVGQCDFAESGSTPTGDDPAALTGVGLAGVELLESDEVRVEAGGTRLFALAPHAFPGSTDFVSGVLYTSRDRTATLPSAARYRFSTTDGPLGALDATAIAPAALTALQLNDRSLEQLRGLSRGEAVAVRWDAGAAEDRVVVVLEPLARPASTRDAGAFRCTYGDDAGAATFLPDPALAAGRARLSVHRVRTARVTQKGAVRGEIRFDFSVASEVELD